MNKYNYVKGTNNIFRSVLIDNDSISERLEQIDWREGELINFYFHNQSDSTFVGDLYLIFSGEFYSIYFLVIARGVKNFSISDYSVDSISEVALLDNVLTITGYSDGKISLEADSLMLQELGKIEITNPYQALIDLGLMQK